MDEDQKITNAVREITKLTIIFCIPGNQFSPLFLESWTEVLLWCSLNDIRVILSNKQGPNGNIRRNLCLGEFGNTPGQKPFQHKIRYDYLMWIGANCVFTSEQLQRLLEYDEDIVSGISLLPGQSCYDCIQKWDETPLFEDKVLPYLTIEEVSGKEDLIEVDYCSLDFTLMKRKVMDSLEYPWFRELELEQNGKKALLPGDFYVCQKLRENGFQINVDPAVQVGIEQQVIL